MKRHRWEVLGCGAPPPWVARCKDCGLIRYRSHRTLTAYHDIRNGFRYLAGTHAPDCPPAFRSAPYPPPIEHHSLYGVVAPNVAHVVQSTRDGVSFRCGLSELKSILFYTLEPSSSLCLNCQLP